MPAAPADELAVLTFHSISPEPGPTSIAPATFRMQMAVLAERGFRTLSCADFIAWHRGESSGTGPCVLLTFDDGYADFATVAHPVLCDHGFGAVVFVPTGKLGGREDWRGANASARPLLDWQTVTELARRGIEFGGHGVSHADLTRLDAERRRAEIEGSARELAQRLGRRPRAFAPPYGHVNGEVLGEIGRAYEVSFGTSFDHARRSCNRLDVPRIEMHYFRSARAWRDLLSGERTYFRARRALRSIRQAGVRVLGARHATE